MQAELSLSLPVEETSSEGRASPTPTTTSPPKYSNMPEADIILRSSDHVDFHVNRSALIASSPFFRDMFSLPQPRNDAVPEALPVVHLSENAETLNSLISMLYAVAPEIPYWGGDILTLLAAATKYDMDAVQSFIRAEVKRKKSLSSPFGFRGGAFYMYAVAYRKMLAPEMAAAARDTLRLPLTFRGLDFSLRLFEGGALRDLADFRARSTSTFSSNLRSFSGGPSKIWVGCPAAERGNTTGSLPPWLESLYTGLMLPHKLIEAIPTPAQLRDRYMKSLQDHVKKTDCNFCMKVHILEGEKYCEKLSNISTQAWNVPAPGESPCDSGES